MWALRPDWASRKHSLQTAKMSCAGIGRFARAHLAEIIITFWKIKSSGETAPYKIQTQLLFFNTIWIHSLSYIGSFSGCLHGIQEEGVRGVPRMGYTSNNLDIVSV